MDKQLYYPILKSKKNFFFFVLNPHIRKDKVAKPRVWEKGKIFF